MPINVKDASGATVTISLPPALGLATSANSSPAVLASDGNHAKTTDIAALTTALTPASGLPVSSVEIPFRPLLGRTVSVTAGPTATGGGKIPLAAAGAIPAGTATSYRVRNPAASASPIAWILTTDATKQPVIPTPFAADGTGGTAGDKAMDPGSVEVIGLSAAQQTALAAGTLYLAVVTPAGGSGVLSITPGNGA